MKEPTEEQILEADIIFGNDGTPLWGNPGMLEAPQESQKARVLLGCPGCPGDQATGVPEFDRK